MKPLLILTILFTINAAHAQDFSMKPKGKISELTVVIENLYSDLEITGTNAAEIKVHAKDYEGIPERAKGLKALSALGPDNTRIGLNISQEGDTVTISGAHRRAADGDYRIDLPRNCKVKIEYGSFQTGDITIRAMANEVEVKSQVGDLLFEDVTGPIVASTLSSDIEVRYSSLSQAAPSSLASVSGDIDVTLPASSKGDFTMSSTSGEVYTDLDFDLKDNKGMKRFGAGMLARASLNGGGVDVTMRTVSGDIYIRGAKK